MIWMVAWAIFAAKGGADDAMGAGFWIFQMFGLVLGIVSIVGMWKAFEKAGQPGWAAIIPFYNIWVLVEMSGKPSSWFFLILCVPCVGIIFLILVYMEIAQKFGQGAGFGIGLAFLGFIFWPMLGFGSAQYEGRRKRRSSAYDDDDDDRPRRRRSRDDDDDDDDDRPRRRARDDDDDDDDDRRISAGRAMMIDQVF